MADTGKTERQDASAGDDFVLLDETELHLPVAGDVVVMAGDDGSSFWQAASGAGEPLPALDELISDHSGQETPAALAAFEGPADALPAEPCLLSPADSSVAAPALSLVDIVVDDGSGGPLVA